MDGDGLADVVVIADLEAGRLALVLLVLAVLANTGELEDAVVGADAGRPLITTCGPIFVPAPITTSGPMML